MLKYKNAYFNRLITIFYKKNRKKFLNNLLINSDLQVKNIKIMQIVN
jgi:hypothetical protein